MAWLDEFERDHDALLGAILEAMPEPFFVLDRTGLYVAVLGGLHNPNYHDGRALVGQRMHDVLPQEIADRFMERIQQALDSGHVISYEYELGSDDVEGVDDRPGIPNRLWFDARIAPIESARGRTDMVVWMISNITEAKRAMRRLEDQQYELERLARTDPLTGLLNRRSFFDEARRELKWVQRTQQPAALVLFDLDHFKVINDTWGHAAGDTVLRSVSELLGTRRRSTDIVARLGGEEVAIVVRGAHLAAGARLAERLRTEIAGLGIVHGQQTISVTASFGVTELRADDAEPEAALSRADHAMYRAKRLGRNRVETDPTS